MDNKSTLVSPVLIVLFFIVVFLCVYQIPFFGDAVSSVSTPAISIFENSGFINQHSSDPGHPTLIPFLLAQVWKIFGQSLWTAHLIQLLFAFGVFIFLRNRLEQKHIYYDLIILISPLLFSQLFTVSLQLPLFFFFLWALNSIEKNKLISLLISLGFLSLVHLQGILYGGALGIYYLFINRNELKKITFWIRAISLFSFPLVLFILWAIVHHKYTGWYISSPNFERSSPDLRGIIYNLGIMGWRLFDFFYLIPILIILLSLHRIKRNDKVLLLILLVLPGIFICLIFSYPPIHRYFLVHLGLIIPIALNLLNKNTHYLKNIPIGIIIIGFAFGNFMYYPGKCIGDANLAYLPVFKMKEELAVLLPENSKVYSLAPLSHENKYTLAGYGPLEHIEFVPFYNQLDSIQNLEFVLESSLTCEFNDEIRAKLSGFRTYYKEIGAVWFCVYIHPDSKESLPWQNSRKTGALERFIERIKK